MNNDRSWTEIDLTSFENNLKALKKFFSPKADFMQIVKADAYGHGAFQIAKKAVELGAVSLGVANVQEGKLLRYQGIEIPIVILSPALLNEIDQIIENKLIPTISTLDFAIKLNSKSKIHINIDSGMGRSGFHYREAEKMIKTISQMKNLEIEGVFSHFASAEDDPDFTKIQSDRFQNIISRLDFKPKYVHISNSAAVVNFPNNYTNLVRLGLLSFGIYSAESLQEKIDLQQVMTFKSRISQIKTACKGESIGYNRTFIADRKIKYAVIPVGYADGYDFLLSNKGKVLIDDKICNVIGKVSMDMIAVDISELEKAETGWEVVLLGPANKVIKAENLSSLYSGSSYELLSQIGRRAKRYFIEHREIIDSSPLLRRDFVPYDLPDKKLGNLIETAIEQRLESKEIASIVYDDILKNFFAEKDRNIHYRKNFQHSIKLDNSAQYPDFYHVTTDLFFSKVLQNDYFIVACAKSDKDLERYFLRNDVEYRWLLDKNFAPEPQNFAVTSVKINDTELYNEMRIFRDCIEIKCYHPYLSELKGKEVDFLISTETYYPKKSHQLGVFITDITQAINIEFIFGNILQNVEAVPIFSGRMKFPQINNREGSIVVSSGKEEWIFPNSGVVFVF